MDTRSTLGAEHGSLEAMYGTRNLVNGDDMYAEAGESSVEREDNCDHDLEVMYNDDDWLSMGVEMDEEWTRRIEERRVVRELSDKAVAMAAPVGRWRRDADG